MIAVIVSRRSWIVGTYIPGPSSYDVSWWKIIVVRKGGHYQDTWYYNDGTTSTDHTSATAIREDLSSGYIIRVPKHLMLQDGL